MWICCLKVWLPGPNVGTVTNHTVLYGYYWPTATTLFYRHQHIGHWLKYLSTCVFLFFNQCLVPNHLNFFELIQKLQRKMQSVFLKFLGHLFPSVIYSILKTIDKLVRRKLKKKDLQNLTLCEYYYNSLLFTDLLLLNFFFLSYNNLLISSFIESS